MSDNPGPPKFNEAKGFFWNWLYLFWAWVTDNMGTDFYFEVASGRKTGYAKVNKFGRAPDGLQTSGADVWDRADATPTQSIWVAPTTARVHNLVSTSANDTSAGTGAQTIRVYGLTSWDEKESSEVVTMAGATPVATSNSFVIIHRMKCLSWGTAGPNVGTITATAVTDASITAQINIGEGQTQMAIYGVPSIQKVYVNKWYGSVNKTSGANVDANFSLKLNPIPDSQLSGFLTKETRGLQTNGTTEDDFDHEIPPTFDGPCILKVTGVSSAVDIEASAGFDLILEDVQN